MTSMAAHIAKWMVKLSILYTMTFCMTWQQHSDTNILYDIHGCTHKCCILSLWLCMTSMATHNFNSGINILYMTLYDRTAKWWNFQFCTRHSMASETFNSVHKHLWLCMTLMVKYCMDHCNNNNSRLIYTCLIWSLAQIIVAPKHYSILAMVCKAERPQALALE